MKQRGEGFQVAEVLVGRQLVEEGAELFAEVRAEAAGLAELVQKRAERILMLRDAAHGVEERVEAGRGLRDCCVWASLLPGLLPGGCGPRGCFLSGPLGLLPGGCLQRRVRPRPKKR